MANLAEVLKELIHHAEVAKAEGFNQCLNDDMMRHGFVG